jgi:hypothetical protein
MQVLRPVTTGGRSAADDSLIKRPELYQELFLFHDTANTRNNIS